MTGWWLVSYVVLWVLLLGIAFLNLAILRQLGLLWVRVGGALGALQTSDGPGVGEPVPINEVADRFGVWRPLVGTEGVIKLLVFLSPSCSICDSLIETIPDFARSVRSEAELLVILSDQKAMEKFNSWPAKAPHIVIEASLENLFEVPTFPYGIAVNGEGRVASKGIVNDMIQLESLINEAVAIQQEVRHDHAGPDQMVDAEGGISR